MRYFKRKTMNPGVQHHPLISIKYCKNIFSSSSYTNTWIILVFGLNIIPLFHLPNNPFQNLPNIHFLCKCLIYEDIWNLKDSIWLMNSNFAKGNDYILLKVLNIMKIKYESRFKKLRLWYTFTDFWTTV